VYSTVFRFLSIMLPLSLLRTAQGHPILVELKNGDTYNGHLVNCDSWMNINLRKVIYTSKDGDKFLRIPECYIRGNTVKYLCIPDEVIDMVQQEEPSVQAQDSGKRSESSRGARGRGAIRGGRGSGSSRGIGNAQTNASSRGGRGARGRAGASTVRGTRRP